MSSPRDSEEMRDAFEKARCMTYKPILQLKFEANIPTVNEGWIEVVQGPIRSIEAVSGHRHCYVPDSRLGSDFESPYTEVYSVRLKRFPLFGRVEGVEWRNGAGGAAGLKDAIFSENVSEKLDQDRSVTEIIMASGLDLVIFTDTDFGSWVICDGEWRTATKQVWHCYRAVAEALLAMPIPGGG